MTIEMQLFKIVTLLIIIINTIYAVPYDDGKYNPKKYKNDDGKYYRPPNEGKYIPGDEGRYRYIYVQGLYPGDDGDYRYIHQDGPRGPDGSPGYPGGYYLGDKIYAERYKHKKFDDWALNILKNYLPIHDKNIYDAEQSNVSLKKILSDEFAFKDVNCSYVCEGTCPRNDLNNQDSLISVYKMGGQKIVPSPNDVSKHLKYIYKVYIHVYEKKNESF